MAEFSNGNFLGQDAKYKEFFKPDHKHYFPFPSLADTTHPHLKPGRLAESLGTVALENLKSGQRAYVRKLGAGVAVDHHSVLNYLATMNPERSKLPAFRIALSINDSNVLQEYHAKLIPKAIEYSAGILDYFFRGRLQVCVGVGGGPGQLGLHIENRSGQWASPGLMDTLEAWG